MSTALLEQVDAGRCR